VIGTSDRYNAQGASRNWFGVFGAGLLAFALSGCSLTMHLASLQSDPEETTATVSKPVSPLDPSLDTEDWRRAQAALNLAVDPQGSGQPVNWDNPTTKRKGSFTQAGKLVLVENTVCRPFTATLVQVTVGQAPKETKHSGQACRVGPGEWALRIAPEAETTAKIKAGNASSGKDAAQPLPLPTTSILEVAEEIPM